MPLAPHCMVHQIPHQPPVGLQTFSAPNSRGSRINAEASVTKTSEKHGKQTAQTGVGRASHIREEGDPPATGSPLRVRSPLRVSSHPNEKSRIGTQKPNTLSIPCTRFPDVHGADPADPVQGGGPKERISTGRLGPPLLNNRCFAIRILDYSTRSTICWSNGKACL